MADYNFAAVSSDGPQLVSVKGWVTRRLVLYVAGTESGGPLSPYGFLLVFEDGAGRRMYTLPLEDEGPLYPRLLKPDADGVIRIGSTPVHPTKGGLVLKALPLDTWSDLTELDARCSYVGCASPTLLFRVDYALQYGQKSTQTSAGQTLGEDVHTFSYGGESFNEGGIDFKGAGGKVGGKTSSSDSWTSPQNNTTSGTSITITRPVAYVQKIAIKSVSAPPDQ